MEPPSPALHLQWPHSSLLNKVVSYNGAHCIVCSCDFMGFIRPSVHAGPPLCPNVEFDTITDSIANFTVCLTWQRQESDLYYLINRISGMEYTQTTTELCLTAEYNTPLHVTVVAVNCAGESEPGTTNITIGWTMFDSCLP